MFLKPLNQLATKFWVKVPLQTVLIVPFVLQTMGAVGLVGYLSFRNGQKAVNQLVMRLSNEVTKHITYHAEDFLEKPHIVLEAVASAVYSGDLTLDNLEQLQCYFFEKLKQPDFGNHLGVGLPNGYTLAVERGDDPEAEMVVKIRDELTGQNRETYGINPQCNLTRLLETDFNYDPRQRAWYQKAVTARKATWSPLYPSEDEGLMELSAVLPIYAQNGNLLGVLTSELTTQELTDLLKSLKLSQSGQALMIERSGAVIASTSESAVIVSDDGAAQKIKITNSSIPLVKLTSQNLLQKFGDFKNITKQEHFILEIQGERELVQVTPLQDRYGLDWLIIVIIPETDFMAEIHANTRTTIKLCLAALMIAILIGILTSRWVIQPIQNLNQAAQDLTQGKWQQLIINAERSDELGRLAQSFNHMAEQLQKSFTNLHSMNEALSASEQRLTQFLEAIPVGVVVYDATGKLFYVNKTANKLLGISVSLDLDTQDWVNGYPIYKAGTETLYPPQELPTQQALNGMPIYVDDLEIRLPEQIITLEAWATPIYENSGRVTYAIAAFQDVTDRKQAEFLLEERAKLAAFGSDVGLALTKSHTLDQILKSCTDAMVKHLDAAFARIWFLNEEENILELKASSGLYTHIDGGHSRVPVGQFKIGLIAQEKHPHITNNVLQDERVGDKEWAKREGMVSFAGYPLKVEQKLVGVIAMFSRQKLPDVRLQGLELAVNTVALAIEHKISEQLLEKYNKNLEKKVAERTTELVVAKEKAEVANQAKSSFIANMSHELRSPLNAVLGFAQVLIRSQKLLPEQEESVGIILRSGEHLLNLINQVLDLSKIESGKTTLDPSNFDLYRLLSDLEDMFLLKADEKRLQLMFEQSPDVPQYVRTDQVKLRQVLINLLNNALKFTHEGGVSVKVRRARDQLHKQNQKFVRLDFEVSDTGSGIAADEVEELFEAFVQTQTGKEAQEGTGLGLPISRKFVQMMGGDIRIISELNQGSIFQFSIRVKIVDEADVKIQKMKRRVIGIDSNQAGYKILIVDDKPLNRKLLFELLNPLGFELREARNGQEAIQVWQEWKPHFIWMDIRMPLMDGYEATRKIKSTEQGKSTAIVALTASVFEEERAVVLSAGCDDFMRKPFREEEIFEMMNKHLGVQYIYEDNIKPNSVKLKIEHSDLLTPENFGKISQDCRKSLQQAVLLADSELIDTVISKIQSQDDDLAQALKYHLNNFEYNQVLTLITDTEKQEI